MEVQNRAHSRGRRENKRGESQGSCGTRSSPRKRSYQREQRRGSNRAEHPLSNDDLRSPCHKQPRFKGQKENTPSNKIIANGDRKGPWNQKHSKNENEKVKLDHQDFPPLGFNLDRYTPEASKDWGTLVQEEENVEQCKENSRKPSKIKRRLMLSDTSDPTPKETTDDKSKASKVLRPMITDQHKLGQRQKQIDIGKNTVSYGNYIKNVPRENRSKDNPWTPDKFQQCSTRSWVGQIKLWRRRLHSYDTESDTKDDLFSTSSTSSSQNTDEIKMEEETQPSSKPIEEMFKDFDLDSCLTEDDGLPL